MCPPSRSLLALRSATFSRPVISSAIPIASRARTFTTTPSPQKKKDIKTPIEHVPAQHTSLPSTHAQNLFDLSGKVFIVTGGGRGLGLTLAEALAEAGGNVHCLDRLETPDPSFTAIASRVPSTSAGSLTYHNAEVTDTKALDDLIGSIGDQHKRMDGLIAAAGVQLVKPALSYTQAELRHMMDINYGGVFFAATSVARSMLKHNTPGAICLIASMSGLIANKGLISPVYNSSKAAVLQLTRNLAMEWGKQGIRVNSLSPGHIVTPMVRENFEKEPWLEELWTRENMMGRLSRPEEFKGAALFLCSGASSFMTGSNLVIDGGHTAW